MSAPEPWRRTGRKAANDHWLGLERLTLIEVSLYDDGGRQQGRGLIQLQERGTEVQPGEGQTWLSRFVGVEDGYYEWWVNAKRIIALTPRFTVILYMWMYFASFRDGAMSL